jgi:TonB-dependent SusC/RagA subfamily outer membrane receptor
MSPPAEIPIAVLREWIQQHHPNVITGDPSVNEVVIVVDANERYLRSYARFDSVPDGARGDGPRGRGNAYVADTVQIRALGSALHRGNPLIIVDGVIVNGVDGIERERIQSVEVLKGAAAVAQYGPAAERGVIVIDTKSESLLSSMDLKADDIRQIDVVKAPPGTIGPNALRVLVVQVKN